MPLEKFKFLTRLHYWAADVVTHGVASPWGEVSIYIYLSVLFFFKLASLGEVSIYIYLFLFLVASPWREVCTPTTRAKYNNK